MGTSKQDRQGARTATDLERKYNFGTTFAEIMGIATDAQKSAEEAKTKIDGLNQEQIFNLLTDNGQNQGAFYSENGELYLNASYIKTGVITSSVMVFVEPGYEEAKAIYDHVLRGILIPSDKLHLYDFDEDGEVTEYDALVVEQIAKGERSLAGWYYAQESEVTITIDVSSPNAVIRFTGTNMWGRSLDRSIGLDTAFLKSAENGGMYRTVGSEKEWLNPSKQVGTTYRTTERFNGFPVYTRMVNIDTLPSNGTRTYETDIEIGTYNVVSMTPVFYDSSGYPACVMSGITEVRCSNDGTDFFNLIISTNSDFYGWSGYVEIKYI